MSCALTSGFTLDCRDSVGGIKAILVAEVKNKGTITASAGVITAFTMASGKQFFRYEFRKQTGSFTETIVTNDENGTLFYEQSITAQLSRLEATKRNELFLLAKNNVMVIVEDRNGKYWLMGQEDGMVLSGAGQTGTAMGDFNGYQLTFTGAEEIPALEVGSGLIAALSAPATP
jgi:hypothetical protein